MTAQPNRQIFADVMKPADKPVVIHQQQQQQPARSATEEALRRWQQGPGQQPQM